MVTSLVYFRYELPDYQSLCFYSPISSQDEDIPEDLRRYLQDHNPEVSYDPDTQSMRLRFFVGVYPRSPGTNVSCYLVP